MHLIKHKIRNNPYPPINIQALISVHKKRLRIKDSNHCPKKKISIDKIDILEDEYIFVEMENMEPDDYFILEADTY